MNPYARLRVGILVDWLVECHNLFENFIGILKNQTELF